jgi:ABC-2 type transport system ATP-binding protein
VLARHGGRLEFVGHPTTTLEDLFLRIVQQSKTHPGRRYLPERGPRQADGQGQPPAPGPDTRIQEQAG